MGDDDNAWVHHREQLDAVGEMVNHHLVALALAVERAADAPRHHAMEMQRYALRRQLDHLGLDGRIAGRHQKPEPRAPADHRSAPQPTAGASCELGVEREISTSSGVMSAGMSAKSGVER